MRVGEHCTVHNTLCPLTDHGRTAFNAYREKMQQALADIAE